VGRRLAQALAYWTSENEKLLALKENLDGTFSSPVLINLFFFLLLTGVAIQVLVI